MADAKSMKVTQAMKDAGVVVLMNLEGGNASDLANDLLKIILGTGNPDRK